MGAGEISSRPATPQDEPFLRELFYIVRAPEFAAAGMTQEQLEPFLAQQYHAMRTYYARAFPETEYLILQFDGTPIGYEALRVTEELHLIDIALIPEYRNQGIGTQRMRRLQAHAAEVGKSIILSVEVFNPAKHLYERLGFSVLEEAGIYQRMGWTNTS
jgi:ribosomal protein S18 acetylase RimI-like enzyme